MEEVLHGKFCSKPSRASTAVSMSTKPFLLIVSFLFVGALIASRWGDAPFLLNKLGNQTSTLSFWDFTNKDQQARRSPNPKPRHSPLSLSCPARGEPAATACVANLSNAPSPAPKPSRATLSASTCPDYFRWIYEDLKPWASTGITKKTLESAEIHAAFRLIVIDGRAYIRHYHNVFQTRDSFTKWGIIQLLRRYPGRVPDLDLMFNCEDMPVVLPTSDGSPPPPLFRYCKDDSTVDIVFPDWSFWGWPEVNIKWWGALAEELREANEEKEWRRRKPYAYWKGNPYVAETRGDLMNCKLTNTMDWNARLFTVDWENERRQGFPNSNLAHNCNYRYNIYVEGRAWSVSEKYILACDSPTLYVESKFQDVVSRGLRPGRHYWPIPRHAKCRAIKEAVDWGNHNPRVVQGIGKTGSSFVKEELKMDYIYDYMLHLLTEYSKLLTYKPTKPEEAVELCVESVACPLEGKAREYLMESAEMAPGKSDPCAMPPPFLPEELSGLMMEKANGTQRLVDALMH